MTTKIVDTILTDRRSLYGSYEDNANLTMSIVSKYLDVSGITAHNAKAYYAFFMCIAKLVRHIRGSRLVPDNFLDIAGYSKLMISKDTYDETVINRAQQLIAGIKELPIVPDIPVYCQEVKLLGLLYVIGSLNNSSSLLESQAEEVLEYYFHLLHRASLETLDYQFMREARLESMKSNDTKAKIGCTLVKKSQIIGGGYNKLPNDWLDFDKHDVVVHAEIDAISKARGSADTAYIYGLPPCGVCLKMMAKVGIKTVFYKVNHDIRSAPEWFEQFNAARPLYEGKLNFIELEEDF